MKRVLVSFLLAGLLMGAEATAQRWASEDDRVTRQSEAIIPLESIVKKLLREKGGRHLDSELISKPGGRAEYHITWEKDGRKIKFVVDAQSGRIIRESGG